MAAAPQPAFELSDFPLSASNNPPDNYDSDVQADKLRVHVASARSGLTEANIYRSCHQSPLPRPLIEHARSFAQQPHKSASARPQSFAALNIAVTALPAAGRDVQQVGVKDRFRQ
ncbi:hypothetical protein D3871_21160 [Noviherbaspirillum saxi]|uniref:Uncharacterized protein n=1 Tax=Noviherbaspirillum saxi TaxID=2320863 RepID=A0A3A3FKP3_9BURK|nr:hypothetical protein D3871_21160 [Noviherbaspirillum saxi]